MAWIPRRTLTPLAFYAGFVLLLVTVPRWIPPQSSGLSAAAADGYNTDAAFWAVLAWSLVGILFFANRHRRTAPQDTLPPPAPAGPGRTQWLEILVVFALFAGAYFPPFLARHAPFSEDQYFLTVLQRMHCGQVPYRDFAFLYGPLMIYPVWGWAQVFGYSMTSYFAYLATFEGAQFALLVAVLQRVLPDRRSRYVVLLVVLPFLLDTLLGFNWNAMRRMIPVFVALLVSLRPYDRLALGSAAAVLGLHLAYSHDYAFGALAAVLGMYGLSFLRGDGWRAVRAGALVACGSALVWLAVAWLLLGVDLVAYIEHAREVVRKMSAGHANFTFYWTANSLALFGLLALACMAMGRGLLQPRSQPLATGDRMLAVALGYAIVVLKSGLNRCDLWHLDAAFLVLIFAFLIPLPTALFRLHGGEPRIAFALVVACSLTYVIGIAPTGSHYAIRYLKGFVDVVATRESEPRDVATRTVCLELERSEPRPHLVAMARLLARDDLASRPVYFYCRAWHLAPFVGVCPIGYGLDDLLYSEDQRPAAEELRAHPDALVVTRRDDYERLYGGKDAASSPPTREPDLTAMQEIGRWLATAHYDSKPLEEWVKCREHDRRIGVVIRSRYQMLGEFKDYIVLQPAPATNR